MKSLTLEEEVIFLFVPTIKGEDIYVVTNYDRNHPINTKEDFRIGSIVILKQDRTNKIKSFMGELSSLSLNSSIDWD